MPRFRQQLTALDELSPMADAETLTSLGGRPGGQATAFAGIFGAWLVSADLENIGSLTH